MHKIVNTINNAFRYKKDCFKVKKNSKTFLFLKCLVKSNVIRYFKETRNEKTGERSLIGYINLLNIFEIKLVSKGCRQVYLRNTKVKMNINCVFVLSNSLKKSYINSFEEQNEISGELVAKIFL